MSLTSATGTPGAQWPPAWPCLPRSAPHAETAPGASESRTRCTVIVVSPADQKGQFDGVDRTEVLTQHAIGALLRSDQRCPPFDQRQRVCRAGSNAIAAAGAAPPINAREPKGQVGGHLCHSASSNLSPSIATDDHRNVDPDQVRATGAALPRQGTLRRDRVCVNQDRQGPPGRITSWRCRAAGGGRRSRCGGGRSGWRPPPPAPAAPG